MRTKDAIRLARKANYTPPVGSDFIIAYTDAKAYLEAIEDMPNKIVRQHPMVMEFIKRLDNHVNGELRKKGLL